MDSLFPSNDDLTPGGDVKKNIEHTLDCMYNTRNKFMDMYDKDIENKATISHDINDILDNTFKYVKKRVDWAYSGLSSQSLPTYIIQLRSIKLSDDKKMKNVKSLLGILYNKPGILNNVLDITETIKNESTKLEDLIYRYMEQPEQIDSEIVVYLPEAIRNPCFALIGKQTDSIIQNIKKSSLMLNQKNGREVQSIPSELIPVLNTEYDMTTREDAISYSISILDKRIRVFAILIFIMYMFTKITIYNNFSIESLQDAFEMYDKTIPSRAQTYLNTYTPYYVIVYACCQKIGHDLWLGQTKSKSDQLITKINKTIEHFLSYGTVKIHNYNINRVVATVLGKKQLDDKLDEGLLSFETIIKSQGGYLPNNYDGIINFMNFINENSIEKSASASDIVRETWAVNNIDTLYRFLLIITAVVGRPEMLECISFFIKN